MTHSGGIIDCNAANIDIESEIQRTSNILNLTKIVRYPGDIACTELKNKSSEEVENLVIISEKIYEKIIKEKRCNH